MTELLKDATQQLEQTRAALQAEVSARQRAERLQSVLYRIASAAAGAEDMQEFYRAIHAAVGELMYANNFYVALYDEARQMINFPFYLDEVDEVDGDIPDPRRWDAMGTGEAKGMTAYLLRTGRPALLTRERMEELVRQGEIQSLGAPPVDWLGVPLQTAGRTVGVLVVQSYRPDIRYSQQDLDLLTFVGQHVAAALERAKLQTETRQRVAELSIINSIGQALARQLDFQAIVDLVGDNIREIFEADTTYIALHDRAADLIRFPYYFERGHRHSVPAFTWGQGLTSQVIQSRQPLLLHTAREWRSLDVAEEVPSPDDERDLNESYLGVPILVGDEAVGMVSVQSYRPHAYDEGHVRLLSTVAANMGVALENARLFLETKRLLEESQQRNAELAVINSVSQGLVQEMDFQAIIQLVGDKIREILQVEKMAIGLYDSQTGLVHTPYYLDRGQQVFQKPFALGQGLTSQVIQSRQPLVLGTVEQQIEHGVIFYPGEEPNPSWLGVPIIVGDKVTGEIDIQSYQAHAYHAGHVRLLTTLAANLGVALENARLFQAERAQARRQAALFRLSAAIAAASDEDEICRRLVEGLQDEGLGYAYVGVFLVDRATGERVERASAGPTGSGASGDRLAPGQGLSERPLLDGRLHYTPDVVQAAGYVPALSTGSEVDVPIHVGETLAGVLVVESRQPHAFGQDDFDALMAAAAQAGVALGRARSLQETHQRVSELATVNSISQALGTELDLDALIELVGEQMRRTFKADIVYVALHDRRSNLIHFPYEYGEKLETIRFGEGLTSRILESGQPLLINEDIEGRHTALQTQQIGVQAKSYLGVPIVVGNEAIGVISVQSTTVEGRFDEADVRLLSTIAANVGIAIENARLYTAAQEAKAAAEAANQAKSAFLSTVSHELRTPLTSVLGFAKVSRQTLENKLFPHIQTDDPKVQRQIRQIKENLQIIVSEGERLTTLINNVLDLAKIEAGKVEWQMQPLAISSVIDRATAATAALFHQNGPALIKDVAADVPEVVGDQDKLIQVVINLISNAVKFTEQGSVTCRTRSENGEIVVSVIDTGLGIAPEDQPKVFEKFKQVGDTLANRPLGTGLGLSICKEIVEHHGGRIWLESEPGQGSTFAFTLPVPPLGCQ